MSSTGAPTELLNWARFVPTANQEDERCEGPVPVTGLRTDENGRPKSPSPCVSPRVPTGDVDHHPSRLLVEEFAPNHPLMSRDEVIAAMKDECRKRCHEHNEANKKKSKAPTGSHAAGYVHDGTSDFPSQIDIENYFSEDYIAPCFWLPRKEKFGGRRWLEDALFIFAQCRNFDFPASSKRFFKFNLMAFPTGISSFDEIPVDVAHVFAKSACFGLSPTPNGLGHPVAYLTCTNFSWDEITLPAAKRAHIWLFWQWATYWGPDISQTRGLMFVVSQKGLNTKQVNLEFQAWCCRIIVGCLPVRTASFQLAYTPFWFGRVLWPVIKHAMPEVIRKRVVWLGTKPQNVKEYFLKTTYPDALPNSLAEVQALAGIPEELGGTMKINEESCGKFFTMTKWRINGDEEIPEDCLPHSVRDKFQVGAL